MSEWVERACGQTSGQTTVMANDDEQYDLVIQNYEMYKAEGDLHLQKGLYGNAVDNYTKVLITCFTA